MSVNWDKTLPVIVSILIILLIAFLRQYSKTLSAIVATMPINIPLGMWIIYAGEDDGQQALTEFSEALLLNIIPTIMFMAVAWQTTKVGWGLLPTVGAGYVVWGIGLLGVLFIRQQFGN